MSSDAVFFVTKSTHFVVFFIIMMKTYTTSKAAAIIGIHPNTVRFYEKAGLITKAIRKPNGYRIFTELHINQMKLLRIALRAEVLQNGLRKKAIEIIMKNAELDFSGSIESSTMYIYMIKNEIEQAKKAISSVENILNNSRPSVRISLKRTEAAKYLDVTVDTLRNWELNGLITVKRKQNGYRIYDENDLRILSIIRTLRCANYSLSSILRLITSQHSKTCSNIEQILNTPLADDDIISACDKLITSLENTLSDAYEINEMAKNIELKFSNPTI